LAVFKNRFGADGGWGPAIKASLLASERPKSKAVFDGFRSPRRSSPRVGARGGSLVSAQRPPWLCAPFWVCLSRQNNQRQPMEVPLMAIKASLRADADSKFFQSGLGWPRLLRRRQEHPHLEHQPPAALEVVPRVQRARPCSTRLRHWAKALCEQERPHPCPHQEQRSCPRPWGALPAPQCSHHALVSPALVLDVLASTFAKAGPPTCGWPSTPTPSAQQRCARRLAAARNPPTPWTTASRAHSTSRSGTRAGSSGRDGGVENTGCCLGWQREPGPRP
jgi:hypothetical protein